MRKSLLGRPVKKDGGEVELLKVKGIVYARIYTMCQRQKGLNWASTKNRAGEHRVL